LRQVALVVSGSRLCFPPLHTAAAPGAAVPELQQPPGMWSQTLKSVTTRRHHDQPELTFDVIVHFVLVLLLGMLIIWRV
jgi:hypothetical protein